MRPVWQPAASGPAAVSRRRAGRAPTSAANRGAAARCSTTASAPPASSRSVRRRRRGRPRRGRRRLPRPSGSACRDRPSGSSTRRRPSRRLDGSGAGDNPFEGDQPDGRLRREVGERTDEGDERSAGSTPAPVHDRRPNRAPPGRVGRCGVGDEADLPQPTVDPAHVLRRDRQHADGTVRHRDTRRGRSPAEPSSGAAPSNSSRVAVNVAAGYIVSICGS